MFPYEIKISKNIYREYNSPYRKTLYSKEYTSDKLPRQKSIDFLGMKDHPYDKIIPIGLPDQNRLYPNIWIQMTEKIQKWYFDVLCISTFGIPSSFLLYAQLKQCKDWWKQFLDDGRCFTNKTGTDTHRDYINETNVLKDDMRFEPLVCGGNSIEIVGKPQYFTEKYFGVQGNYKHYPIRAINTASLPSPQLFLKDRYVCHTPTTIKPDGTTGLFPQFNGHAVYPIWVKNSNRVWVWEKLIN